MMRALIVDDRMENLYLLRVLLQGHGWEVEEASNGAEALNKARRSPPDLIVSDLLMPIMDGYTLLRHWKADERLRRIPFVVYTATYTEPKDERLALDLGADAFLIKPLEPEPFMARIQETLSNAASGELQATGDSIGDEAGLFKEYSEVLVNKLEAKVFDLERVNRELQEEIGRREQTEVELMQARRAWEDIFQSIGQPTIIMDLECRIIAANSRCADVTGKPVGELPGMKCYEVFHKDGQRCAGCPMEALIESGVSGEAEVEALGGHYLVSCTPIVDADGKVRKVIHTATDISDCKKAEKRRLTALERQEKLNGLLRSLISQGDLSKKLKMITDAVVDIFSADFCRIWRIGPGDLCGRGCVHASVTEGPHVCRYRDKCLHLVSSSGRYTHTDGLTHRRVPFGAYKIGRVASDQDSRFLTNNAAHDPRVHNHQWASELGLVSFAGYQIRPGDGDTLGVLALFSQHAINREDDAQLGALSSAVAQAIQVAEIQQEMTQSETRLKEAQTLAHLGNWELDHVKNTLFWSDEVFRIFEIDPTEFGASYDAFLNLVHPEDRVAVNEAYTYSLESGKPYEIIHRLKFVDGRIKHVHERCRTIYDESGAPLRSLGTVQDVSDLKKAEHELGESERRLAESEANLRSFFDAIPQSLFLLKLDGTILTANQCFADRYDRSPASLVGQNIFDVFPPESVHDRRRFFDKVLRTRRPQELFDARLGRRIHTLAYPVFNEDGALDRVALYAVDITDSIEMEQSLQRSEERYKTIVDLSPMGIFVNLDGRFAYANQSFATLIGASDASELIGQPTSGLWHPDFHDIIQDRMRHMKDTGRSVSLSDQKYLRLDGSPIDVEVAAAPIDYEGRTAFLVIVNDITDRKLSEIERLEAQRRLEMALDGGHIGFWDWSIRTGELIQDRRWLSQLGYSEGEVARRIESWEERVHPEDKPIVDRALQEHLRGDSPVYEAEHRLRTKSGEWKWILTRGKVVEFDESGRPVRMLGTHVEIHERKLAEQALRESEKRFRQVAEVAGEWIWEVDENGLYQYCSSAVEQILGYSPEELMGKRYFWEFLQDTESRDSRETPLEIFRQANLFHGFVSPHVHKKGMTVIVETSGCPILDEKGAFRGFRGTNMDVTERVKARESRELLAAVVDHAAEAIVVTDTQAHIKYVNPAFETTTGYGGEEVLGSNPRFLKSGHHDEDFYRNLWETITDGRVWQGNLINRKKNGSLFEEEVTISPIRGVGGRIVNYVAIKRDVTKEAQLQRQLIQSQKMEAIGTLAGGIAHDFNNMIFAMTGYTELAMEDLPPDSPARSDLERVLSAGKRAGEMAKQILTFSRGAEHAKQPLDLSPVVKEGLKFLRASIPSTIEIRRNIGDSLGKVNADPTQMHQVLMNLCTNASHAMRDTKGVLSINLTGVDVDPEYAALNVALEPGKYIKLSVSDTGHGIPPGLIDRIFEPYFTTKDAGEGTGLGLSVIHGIVRDHGGAITVYSEPGQGATFSVFLPVMAVDAEAERSPAIEPVPGGHERILLIDDEPALVEMERTVLERLGYRVVAKTSPLEALALFKSDPGRFDIIVTDLTMPKMTGVELAREIAGLLPGKPVVLCTGFGHGFTEEEIRESGIHEVIRKPMSKHDVAKAVRKALDDRE